MSQAIGALGQHGSETARWRGTVGGLGGAAFAVAAGIVVYGAYGDPHPKASQEAAVPFLLVVAAATTAVVFALLVPKALRALREETIHAARWGVIHSVVAMVLFPAAFWSGVPLIVGSAGAWLGLRTRRQRADAGSPTRPGTAAIIMGAIAVGGTILFTVLGNLAHAGS